MPLVTVAVPVGADGCVDGRVMRPKVRSDASKCPSWAQELVIGAIVADRLAANSILLVIEREGCVDVRIRVQVIQRRVVRGEVSRPLVVPADTEHDVHESEGLGAAVVRLGFEVLGGSQEPVETDNDEVNGGSVGLAFQRMVGIQGFVECPDDGDVDRVGSFRRVIFVAQGFEERSE